jgi:hypothetical protein
MLSAAVSYVVITALLFRHLLPVFTTHLYGDLGDPLLNASSLAWNAKHPPLSRDWWNLPAFAPLSGVTAFTEHLLGRTRSRRPSSGSLATRCSPTTRCSSRAFR